LSFGDLWTKLQIANISRVFFSLLLTPVS